MTANLTITGTRESAARGSGVKAEWPSAGRAPDIARTFLAERRILRTKSARYGATPDAADGDWRKLTGHDLQDAVIYRILGMAR